MREEISRLSINEIPGLSAGFDTIHLTDAQLLKAIQFYLDVILIGRAQRVHVISGVFNVADQSFDAAVRILD